MNASFICKQSAISLLLWFAYGSCYLLRKPFGIIKFSLQNSLHLSNDVLGHTDFAFSLPYALGSLLLSAVGDKAGPRLTLGCGLLVSGVATSVMGSVSHYYEICILLFISGLFQALCWPAACSILISWFDSKYTSIVMTVYGSCFLAGGICGSLLTVHLESAADWRNVFALPAVIVCVIGIIILFFGRPNSEYVSENPNLHQVGKQKAKGLSVKKVFNIPTVPEVSIALAFAKGLKTAVTFWLPLYFVKVLNLDVIRSGLFPLTYEVGGIIGSIIIAYILGNILKISDILTCCISSLVCGVVFLAMLLVPVKLNVVLLHFVLFITGALSSLMEITLCGSIPSKIGEEMNAKTSVVGVVNGLGSLGNVVEGPLIAVISSYFGTEIIIFVFSALCFLSFLFTLRGHFIYLRVKNKNAVAIQRREDISMS